MSVPYAASEGLQVDTRGIDDALQVDHAKVAPEVVYHTESYASGSASDTNSWDGHAWQKQEKEYVAPHSQQEPESATLTICGIRRRRFWIALFGAVVILAAIAGGVAGGIASKNGKSATTPPNVPTAPASSTAAIANGSKLAAIAFNDTNEVLQRRVYYQDASDNIRESSWNASSKTWYVSNESVVKAKLQSPIAAAAKGLPEFSSPQINLYALNSSNLVNEWTLNPSSSSTWSSGSLNSANIQAASTSNLAAISHSHPGCSGCDNETIVLYEDAGNKLNVGRGNSSGWTWTTLSHAAPSTGSGLALSMKWYPEAITGIRLFYQNASGINWESWDNSSNDTDATFTNWIYRGILGGSSPENSSVAAFAWGTNTTTGLPMNIEILSSTSHGVSVQPWLGATEWGAWETRENPSAMAILDAYTPLAADGDGQVYGMQSGIIKEFVVSGDGKSTWSVVGSVATE